MVSVILPTFNEALNIEELLKRTVAQLQVGDEIIVVDDNSPDGTAQLATQFASPEIPVRLILRTANPGLTASLRDGIKACRNDLIIWFDADLSQPPEHIPLLLKKLQEVNADIVVASRYVDDGNDVRGRSGIRLIQFQVFLSGLLRKLSQWILTDQFNDWSSGYICIKKSVLQSLRPLEGGHGEYFIPLIYQALKKNFKVVEIPYSLIPRAKGESKTGATFFKMILTGQKYLRTLFKTRLKYS